MKLSIKMKLPHPLARYMKYLVEECYLEDYNPYDALTWRDNYCYEYTFAEWYFFHRRRFGYKKKYQLTPSKLIIGGDIFDKWT